MYLLVYVVCQSTVTEVIRNSTTLQQWFSWAGSNSVINNQRSSISIKRSEEVKAGTIRSWVWMTHADFTRRGRTKITSSAVAFALVWHDLYWSDRVICLKVPRMTSTLVRIPSDRLIALGKRLLWLIPKRFRYAILFTKCLLCGLCELSVQCRKCLENSVNVFTCNTAAETLVQVTSVLKPKITFTLT